MSFLIKEYHITIIIRISNNPINFEEISNSLILQSFKNFDVVFIIENEAILFKKIIQKIRLLFKFHNIKIIISFLSINKFGLGFFFFY
jgi:hypothetical protein